MMTNIQNRKWHLIDLKGKTLGRISTEIAKLLIGKDKATFSPNVDDGDYVIALNSDEIVTTGTKTLNKKYYNKYTGKYMKEYEWTLLKKYIENQLAYLDKDFKKEIKKLKRKK